MNQKRGVPVTLVFFRHLFRCARSSLRRGANKLFKKKAGEPVNFFVTFGPTQAVLPFCAGCLVAANLRIFGCILRKVKREACSGTST
jgi:hypothetical protein